jgi:hypothetical protein
MASSSGHDPPENIRPIISQPLRATDDMHLPRLPSPAGSFNASSSGAMSASRMRPRPSSLHLPRSAWYSHPMPSPPPPSQPSPDRPANPILRWFHTSFSTPSSRRESPAHSAVSSLPSSPRSALGSLQDALNSDIPALPEAVYQLPSDALHSHPQPQTLAYPPSIMRSLTQTTLPTASISYTNNGPTIPEEQICTDVPVFPAYSPPTRTSLETLRSVQRRTSTVSRMSAGSSHLPQRSPKESKPFSTSFVPSWWWSQSENKENVDHLLAEEDRAETAEQEQAKIQKKCTSQTPHSSPRILNVCRSFAAKSYRVLPWSHGFRFGQNRPCFYAAPGSYTLARDQGGARSGRLRSAHYPCARDERS